MLRIGIVALLLSAAAAASAQSPADLRAARELFREGLAHANEGRWQEARARFERSYTIAPRLPTLLNLAGAQVQTGQLVLGVESYRRFVSEAQGGREARYVDRAREAMAAAEARIAHLVVRAELAEGEGVTLDGEPLAAASIGVGVPVDPGPHVVRLVFGAEERAREDVELDDGERREVVLAPSAVDLRVASAESAPAEPARGAAAAGDDTGMWIGIGVAIAVAVAAALAVGIYFAVADATAPYSGNLGPGMIQFD